MIDYNRYTTLKRSYYYHKDAIKNIYHIFEGTGGNQIITSDIIPPQIKVKELLITSNEMDQAFSTVLDSLHSLNQQNDDARSFSALFYFSQYGGSKTQFLHMVKNEVERTLPNFISILFEDLTQLQPRVLFDKILAQIYQNIGKINRFDEDSAYYREFFRNLNSYITRVQVELNQSGNLKKAASIIDDLRKTKNPAFKQSLDELDDLLHSTILIDNVGVLNRIVDLLNYCSQHGFVFLFLFDEVDLWLAEYSDKLQFSDRFLKITEYMKLIFEIPENNVKSFFLFACTDRVNYLFQSQRAVFSAESPAASRLVRIYDHAEKTLEPGSYGDRIGDTLIKLSVYYNLAREKEIDTRFFQKTLKPLTDKYKSFSRRNCNSKIIELLECYTNLVKPLESGMKEWERDITMYGKFIEDNIQSILKRLSINFIREQTMVDPERKYSKDKVDGYIENYTLTGDKVKLFVEIKVTKEFKSDKAYQALQWLQLHPADDFILIIFSPSSIDEIKKECIKHAEQHGYDLELLKRLHYIHVKDPYAFCSINAIKDLGNDSTKIGEFFKAYAVWLDFYGDFTKQFQTLKQEIGVDLLPVRPVVDTHEQLVATGTDGEKPAVQDTRDRQVVLTSEERVCITLLVTMFRERSFSPSGRVYKSKIQSLNEDKGLGIADLENVLEEMKRAGIILKITDKTVNFTKEILDLPAMDEFSNKVTDYFRESHKDALTRFI